MKSPRFIVAFCISLITGSVTCKASSEALQNAESGPDRISGVSLERREVNPLAEDDPAYLYALAEELDRQNDQNNLARIVDLLKKSASMGHSEAQYSLGVHYKTGRGVEVNLAAAATWFLKAAEQGNADAQVAIAVAYFMGGGVPRDPQLGIPWLRKAARQGHALAQTTMGTIYAEGELVAKDHAKAIDWFSKAASNGEPDAQKHLGTYCEAGLGGMPVDYDCAVEWYRKAAIQGSSIGQFNLARLYWSGAGGPQSWVLAYVWMNIAAANGDEDAPQELSTIAKQLDPGELERARELSRRWRIGRDVVDSEPIQPKLAR